MCETCRVSCQNKFMKLVHLFGFIINKPEISSVAVTLEAALSSERLNNHFIIHVKRSKTIISDIFI